MIPGGKYSHGELFGEDVGNYFTVFDNSHGALFNEVIASLSLKIKRPRERNFFCKLIALK